MQRPSCDLPDVDLAGHGGGDESGAVLLQQVTIIGDLVTKFLEPFLPLLYLTHYLQLLLVGWIERFELLEGMPVEPIAVRDDPVRETIDLGLVLI